MALDSQKVVNMRMDITISTSIPEIHTEQRMKFVERVLEAYREVFPQSTVLSKAEAGEFVPPVTVTFFPEEPEVKHGN